jgi:tRNA(Arg) A34 adenosine deaminase TadA
VGPTNDGDGDYLSSPQMTYMTELSDIDLGYMRRVIARACAAVEEGNRPFAAVLVAMDGAVLAESCDMSNATGNPLDHAEINVLRMAHVNCGLNRVAGATLYANSEPCSMCAGAILRYGLARVIYGTPAAVSRPYISKHPRGLSFPSAPIFALAGQALQVLPEVLLEAAKRPFELYAAKQSS